jgi:hypothetical protein
MLKILFLIALLGFCFNPNSSFGIPLNIVFEIKVVGYVNQGMIPGPCPPNVQCTYDYQGWYDMALGLAYEGDSSITIIDVQVIQTLNVMGSYWNKSNHNQIILQNITLNKGETFYFLAEGIRTLYDGPNGVQFFPLYVKITDIGEHVYWIYKAPLESHSQVTNPQFLSSLPFISRPGIISASFFLFLISLICVVIIRREINNHR